MPLRRSTSWTLLSACLLVTTLASADPVAADAIIDTHSDAYGLTGGAVAVLRGDEVVYERVFGLADVEQDVPMTRDSLFQLSSTTKIFTGTLMAVLAEEGLVDYETPIREYLPDLPEAWSDVLLEDIMSHTSGLPEVLQCNEPDDAAAAMDCVSQQERAFARREGFRYTQTNYMLALQIIETVTESPFEDVLAEKLLVPAGMTSAVLNGNSSDAIPGRAAGYYPDGDGGLTPREYRFPPYLLTAAGLNASIGDLIAFARALAADELLDDTARQRMWQPPLMANGEPGGYALGWELDPMRDGERSAGHEGGFLNTIRTYPAADLTVIYLTNGMRTRYSLDMVADMLALAFDDKLFDPVETFAYEAKLEYLTAGVDATEDFLDASAGNAALSDSDIHDVANWLTQEIEHIGHAQNAELLRARFVPGD